MTDSPYAFPPNTPINAWAQDHIHVMVHPDGTHRLICTLCTGHTEEFTRQDALARIIAHKSVCIASELQSNSTTST